jgi:hypothetical protein
VGVVVEDIHNNDNCLLFVERVTGAAHILFKVATISCIYDIVTMVQFCLSDGFGGGDWWWPWSPPNSKKKKKRLY